MGINEKDKKINRSYFKDNTIFTIVLRNIFKAKICKIFIAFGEENVHFK